MAIDHDTIRAVFLQHGFTVKEGQADLKPYVFEAAEALLDLQNLAERIRTVLPADAQLARSQWLTVEEAYAQYDGRHKIDLATFKALCAKHGWRWERPLSMRPVLTEDQIHTLRCAAENMRSDDDSITAAARFRLAHQLEHIANCATLHLPKD
jgi:hypothetical protein